MRWKIEKVTNPTSSIPYVVFSLSDSFLYPHVPLIAKLEVANKALAEEKASRQVADHAIWASQEFNSALT
jgi:hypothetical protein